MKPKFAITSNTERFLTGYSALQHRASPEASWLLVTGRPGYGKSETVRWWSVQQGAVYLRARTNWTPHWAMSDLLRELGHAPSHRAEDMFGQLLAVLGRDPRPVVIDEIEHTLHNSLVLETFRDLSDLIEIPIIAVGMEEVRAKLLRREQISSRICQAIEFGPATRDDIAILATTLCEVQVSDDLLDEVHSACSGMIRVILDALAEIERHGKRNKIKDVSLQSMAGQKLIHDWRARKDIRARTPAPGRLEAVR